MRYEMNSKEITNIRKRKWQTNGKTDGMGTRKILDETMTNGHGNGHPKCETKNEDGNYWKNL
jgi:hypothetical protein